jgi:hypothetical protein
MKKVHSLDQRNQAKLQWFEDPSQSGRDKLSCIKCITSIHVRNKKRKWVKDTANELETDGKNKNIRDMYRAIN